MANANGSQAAVNIGNRRVRGTKPDDAAAGAAVGARRAHGIALRGALEQAAADGNVAPPPGKGAPTREPAERPKGTVAKVAAVADLLRNGIDSDGAGDDADDDGTGDQAPGDVVRETGETTTTHTLETIAETLGVEVADLWDVEYRDGAGNVRKLGELKDLMQADVDHDARELAFGERKSADENELMRQRQELDYIVRNLPKSAVTPELATRAKAERERVLKLEAERTAAAIPEWRNAETRKTERAAIGEWLKQYGYGAGDLERMFDHRMLKVLRDSWQRYERVTAALAKAEELRGKPSKVSRGANTRRTTAPALGNNPTTQQKVSAVAALLRNGLEK